MNILADNQYGLMNILAVWTLFIEHPLSTTQTKITHTGDVEHVAEENVQ